MNATETERATHTPLPWVWDADDFGIYQRAADGSCGPQIARIVTETDESETDAVNRADAALIVRAVNAHADLLAACEGAKVLCQSLADDLHDTVGWDLSNSDNWCRLVDAIARAKRGE